MFPCRLAEGWDLVAPSLPRESRPGLQLQMGAKPQWHPSHLQTHSAWVQTHQHKIKLCFFLNQLTAAVADSPRPAGSHHICLCLCNAFHPWIGTKRGFIYHLFPLLAGSTETAAFVTQADRKHMDTGIPCHRQTRAADRTREKSMGCSVLHPLCMWHLMAQL